MLDDSAFDSEFDRALREVSSILIEDHELDSMLRRVTELATSVTDCDSASVTLIDNGRASTSAATDERMLDIDHAQYDVGTGPCLEAYRSGRIQRVLVEEADERWPEFTKAARALGVQSFLAVPLRVRAESIGALNLFSSKPHGFGELDDRLATRFADQASVAVQNARLYRSAVTLADQLAEAMTSRAAIEQAKGVLMGRHGIDAEAAFDLLRAQSQRENRKLRTIAEELIARIAK